MVVRVFSFRSPILPLLLSAAFTGVGCKSTDVGIPEPLPDREQRMKHGYLFYLDGAGGGTAHKN